MPETLITASPEKLVILIVSFITLIYCSWLTAEAYKQSGKRQNM